ncbi:MAG: alpha/beta hydrolase [Gammaproteobacteria bacterium]
MSVIPVVSSRKHFYKAGKISKRDRIRLVDLSDPRPANSLPVQSDLLLDQVRDKHVVVLVHGYNCTFSNVCDAYLRIIDQLREKQIPFDEVVGYVWPGGDRAISYWTARNRAKQLSVRIKDMLDTLALSASAIDIVAHSMGCFLSLATLSKMGQVDSKKIRNLYLMAAAVKNYKVSEGRHFSNAAVKCNSTFVFKSQDDTVLRYAFPVGAGGCDALGYTGPVPFDSLVPNSLVVDCSHQGDPIDHGSYSRRSEIYDFISRNPGPVLSPGVTRL